ncbi:MAG: NAD(P)/FAD-dependent oxidoreductase [Spirochaetota bacterium]|nr:NAD(P)/FAD-dependent oxidoreductase [Spirochaetota bacterium]
MTKKKIVVLGGGYGGITALKKLYRRFGKKADIEITLIDRNPYHTLMTELHEVAGSRVEPDSVQVSFARIFGGTRIKRVTDTIVDIDFENNTLKSESNSYRYDYLIIGAGGEPEFFDIPGVQENSFTLWSFEDAMRLRTQIESRFREATREPDTDRRRRMLTFVIAGAGFTGIELAGEIIERKKTLCRAYHIDQHDVRVVIVEALDTILPILPPKMQYKAERFLKKKGAEILTESPVVGAEKGVVKLSDERTIKTDTFIWTCGIHGSEFSARVTLTKGQCAKGQSSMASAEGIHGMSGCRFEEDERYIVGERGRIEVNEEMQSVDYSNVYLVGDIIWYVDNDKVVPQIVETALQTGEVAAENVIADIEQKKRKQFKPNYHGFMVSIGSTYGVAHVGGISLSGIFAMGMKHLINLHYLFGIAGVNTVWRYLQHEFFTIRERRSFVGEHLAAKIPVYWAVPLRLFLGAKWLYEGVKKVLDGWLNPENIYIVATDAGSAASEWVEGGGEAAAGTAAQVAGDAVSQAASQAADTVAAASQALEQGAEGAAEAAEAAWANVQPLLAEPLGIYTWMVDTFVSQAPYVFQAGVVLAEVAIGLALIGGLFTFPAAMASLGLCLMFTISAMSGPEILWYAAAAIVMLGGAGRGFGLDHYVMPWLKDKWNGTKLAQRTHLYDGEPVIKE